MIPRMTQPEILQFVMNWCDGQLFTSRHIRETEHPRMVGMVFMPLALGGLADLAQGDTENIGLIWEYLSAAGPLGINGYPTFFSCRLMHKDDVEVLIPLINAEQDRRKEYLKG